MSQSDISICKICNNVSNNKSYIVQEMMFGYRDKFEYFECAKCGCLQIKEALTNPTKYYPKDYYSFQGLNYSRPNFFKRFRRHQRARYWLYEKNLIGILLSIGRKKPHYFDWLRMSKVKFESKILDIGCGGGGLLLELAKYGFSNLTGIDPFIRDDIHYENSVRIFKKSIFELEGQFDFIMLHDSFEHMQEPLAVFKELYLRLETKGCILIKTPVSGCFAWRKYGVDWVQLDVPRHLFLHTPKSIQILAEQTGLELRNITFDSTAFQFWGSEQYRRDIPLRDSKSYYVSPQASIFSERQIKDFDSAAVELNKKAEGDSACFYLYKR